MLSIARALIRRRWIVIGLWAIYGAYATMQAPRTPELLNVRGGTNRPTGDQLVYLLAVKTSDAEKLVYMEQGQALYASLVKDDAPAAGGTSGADAGNILQGDPASSAG